MKKVVHQTNFRAYIAYGARLAGLIGLAILSVLTVSLASNACTTSSASAASLGYSLTVNPVMNITFVSLSSNNILLDLDPGLRPFGTADLDVSVSTSYTGGYKLYMNAKDDKLTNTAASDYINTLSSSTTESTFPANSWGYRISALSSGNVADNDIVDTTGTNFYKFVSGAMIGSSPTAVNNNVSTLTFASKVNYEKLPGTYNLNFEFKALPQVSTYEIQNLDPAVCTSDPTLVTDNRDGKAYMIARLGDGNCWMTQNLRFTGTEISPDDTNIDVAKTITYGELATGNTSANSYNQANIHIGVDNNGDPTVWYNYAAATAMTITTSYNYDEAQYSLCPAGWRLPSKDEFSAITGYASAFSPVANGRYSNGTLGATQYGYWWSSTTDAGQTRYVLAYGSNSGVLYIMGELARYDGRYVRCLLTEPQP